MECLNGKGMETYILRHVRNFTNNTQGTKSGDLFRQGMTLEQYTLGDVSQHSDSKSCWIVLLDKVYDVTEFIADHPGGEEIILENAGCDATIPFESKGHSVEAYEMIEKYCIGELVEADRRIKK